MIKERWQTIPGFEDYQASTFGRIRRAVQSKNNHKVLKILKPNVVRNRMLQVTLYKNGETYGLKVHRLVAITFLKKKSENQTQVNHKNGDRSNNRTSNLEWCTPKENIQHSIKTGLRNNQARGERVGSSKLTEDLVKEILNDIKIGIKWKEAKMKYQITQGTFLDLKKGRTWKHVTRP